MKLKPTDVKYLVFEGGGGKGATYLGVLQSLEELGVINHFQHKVNNQTVNRLDTKNIKGIAGTSVGSLTALLIALGYTSDEVTEFLGTNLTDQFLDTVEFGLLPTIVAEDNPTPVIDDPRLKISEAFADKNWFNFLEQDEKTPRLLKMPLKMIKEAPHHLFALMFRWYLYYEARKKAVEEEDLTFLPTPADIVRSRTLKNAVDKILNDPTNSFNSLKHEFGFFLGKGLRDVVDKLIEERSGIKNCTFGQFYKEFGVDLVVCSFDMYAKKVVYFRNSKEWSNLAVADAIRMSVSIPFVFKPVVMNIINNRPLVALDDPATLHYFVDGGVANNFPIHAFDKNNDGKLNPKTLGFTLAYKKHLNPFIEEVTFFEYLEDVFLTILKKTTELQLKSSEEYDQVIDLDPGNLKVLDFSFDELPSKVISNAKKQVLEYFS